MTWSRFIWLGLVLMAGSAAAAQENPHSAQVGDLQVTATAAGEVSPEASIGMGQPAAGYHLVVVSATTKNTSAYRSCTEFDPLLQTGAAQNDRVAATLGAGKAWPQTTSLQPGGQSAGSYVFTVKDGLKPVALVMVRHITGEDLCALADGRPAANLEAAEIRVTLDGLPSPESAPPPESL